MKINENQSFSGTGILAAMQEKAMLIVGDLMLDRYSYGNVRRLSPEAPVPVLNPVRDEDVPGGAANVLASLSGLGVKGRLIGAVADDEAGAALQTLCGSLPGASCDFVICEDRPTTIKHRFVAGDADHLLRVDHESANALAPDARQTLLEKVKEALAAADILVLSDYNKGVLKDGVAEALIALAAEKNIPVLVDPKGKDYARYKGASVIAPNRKELAEATAMPARHDDEIVSAAQALMKITGSTLVVKRSEDGLSVFEKDAVPVHMTAQAAQAKDVSGAGDTVVATLAAALAGGAALSDAAYLANVAAAIGVEKAGTCVVTSDELKARLETRPVAAAPKKAAGRWGTACDQIARWQKLGMKVGFTNGCFDILHYGHVTYLAQARAKCDRLVVGLNADASVRRLKGAERPLHDEESRAAVLSALSAVDLVVLFGADEKEKDMPCDLIAALKPDIHFKGGDYTEDQLPEAKIVRAYGGDVCIMPLQAGHSTTSTVNKMKKGEAA